MNHRRSPRGYHTGLRAGAQVCALLPACAPLAVPPARAVGSAGQPWREERESVVARINEARAEARLRPLGYDAVLERVGDLHCGALIAEGRQGHFSRTGVPPYLRYLLAGGSGFHRENVATYSSTVAIPEGALRGILERSVASMLAEAPPDDGHRRALLDRDLTHIGVGISVRGGEVRMTHELATEGAVAWTTPASAARPRARLVLTGTLARPWRPVAAQVLRGPLPQPLSDAQAHAIRTYGYPPCEALFEARREESGGGSAALPFAVDAFGNFAFRWSAGDREGVEIAVVLGSRDTGERPVPVAASATVVTATGDLPPDLAGWKRLAPPAVDP